MADGLDLKVEVEGSEAIIRMLDQVGLEVKDLRPAMQDIGKSMKTFFSGNVFASRGGVIGESCPRLDSYYAVYKARRWPGRTPLVKTGLMQRSFSYATTAASVTVTNKAPHFVYHQSTASRSRLPRRAMMKLTDQVASDAKKIVSTHLAKRIQARTR